MAPEIEKVILPAPELNFNRIGQIIPLVIEMDRTIAVVDLLALAQVDNTEIVRECVWIFLKTQPKSQNVVEALLEPASSEEGFLVLSEDGVLAFEAGTD